MPALTASRRTPGGAAASNSGRISRAGIPVTPGADPAGRRCGQWRAAAVERIRALRPRRVLEIGVGSGLLLSDSRRSARSIGVRISPRRRSRRCKTTWPSSASGRGGCGCGCSRPTWPTGCRRAISTRWCSTRWCSISRTRGICSTCWAAAMGLLAPGGAVFSGDVRQLSLLREFTTGVVVRRADPADTAAVLRERVRREMLGRAGAAAGAGVLRRAAAACCPRSPRWRSQLKAHGCGQRAQ